MIFFMHPGKADPLLDPGLTVVRRKTDTHTGPEMGSCLGTMDSNSPPRLGGEMEGGKGYKKQIHGIAEAECIDGVGRSFCLFNRLS